MVKLIVIPHTPMGNGNGNTQAASPRRLEKRQRYSPNVRISARRETPKEAEKIIAGFFDLGGFDPRSVGIEGVEVIQC
jgi:hypothetical protein